jgi:uncharacterized protein (TIGR02391 family)
MELTTEDLLSPRIRKHCLPLWQDGNYKHAAHEAMIQVEQALKEKGLVQQKDKKFGHTLVTSLFKLSSQEKSIKLRVPLGDDLQQQAEALFHGVFSYYRNYTAHDGSKIDKSICVRVMVLASELLDLIDASALSFADVGGVEGLVEVGPFSGKQDLLNLLLSLENQYIPYGEIDGLTEQLEDEYGLTEIHIHAAIDLDLVRYTETEYAPSLQELKVAWRDFPPPDVLGHFELTELGERVVEEIKKNVK